MSDKKGKDKEFRPILIPDLSMSTHKTSYVDSSTTCVKVVQSKAAE